MLRSKELENPWKKHDNIPLRKAAEEGRTLTALIEEGLRRLLKERPPAAKAGRVSLPVSSAGGGLMPEIDLSDAAALQEMDDLDAAGRLSRSCLTSMC